MENLSVHLPKLHLHWRNCRRNEDHMLLLQISISAGVAVGHCELVVVYSTLCLSVTKFNSEIHVGVALGGGGS